MNTVRKNSRKRQAILEAIRGTKEHPSAEWLYAKLKPAYPDLSLGTVYRNLGIFRTDGLVNSVGTVCGQERFDGDTHPHAHFVCTICGKVEDLEMPFPNANVYDKLGRQVQGEITGHQLSFFGICESCVKKRG